MAGRDNVMFVAQFSNGATAGTVVPFSLFYGVENVRQGYGTPRLKNVRAFHNGGFANANAGVPISIKNSNWIDEAGLLSLRLANDTALNDDSLCFMRGRDKVLQPNTSWIINATLPENATGAGYIYVILEIEYSDVPGINTEAAAGSPVMKTCTNSSVTGNGNTVVPLGTFDNMLQGVTYVISEISSDLSAGGFIIVEGFSSQKGLIRIIPVKNSGLAYQIEGSVYLLKQTYNVSCIPLASLSAASVSVRFEMIASAN